MMEFYEAATAMKGEKDGKQSKEGQEDTESGGKA